MDRIMEDEVSGNAEKICTKCLAKLPISMFHRQLGSVISRCKVCRSEYDRKRYKSDRENQIARVVAWNKANPDKRKALAKKHRESHKDHYRFKNSLNKRKRQQRVPSWLTQEQLKQIEYFYWLARDLKAVSGEEYHVDHIHPLQGKNSCGLHVPWNLQILPSDINLKKGNSWTE